jgi:hypothetical protein
MVAMGSNIVLDSQWQVGDALSEIQWKDDSGNITGRLGASGNNQLYGYNSSTHIVSAHKFFLTGSTPLIVTSSAGNPIISGSATSTGSFGALYTDGNVGIGVTDPDNVMEIKFDAGDRTHGLHLNNDNSGGYGPVIYFTANSTLSARIYSEPNDSNNSEINWQNRSGGTLGTRMTLKNTNLGIGTSSPTTTLDVSGSLRSYSLTIQSEADTSCSINFTQANNFFIDLQHDSALSASHDSLCVGQSGVIAVRQDVTGGRVLTLPSTWKTPRGASITWNDDPDDMNLISYYIVSSSFVAINYMGDFS